MRNGNYVIAIVAVLICLTLNFSLSAQQDSVIQMTDSLSKSVSIEAHTHQLTEMMIDNARLIDIISSDNLLLLLLIAILVVIVFFIGVLLIMVFVVRSKRFRDFVLDKVINDRYVKKDREWLNLINKERGSYNNDQETIRSIVDRIVFQDSFITKVVDKVKSEVKNSSSENEQEMKDSLSQTQINDVILFASCVNENNNSFYEVTDQPVEHAIYKLTANGDKASFEVYDKAVRKILESPSFLAGGCETPKTDGKYICNIKPGLTEKQPDGVWVVKQKAIIHFK